MISYRKIYLVKMYEKKIIFRVIKTFKDEFIKNSPQM
jgi:hypothetical protein